MLTDVPVMLVGGEAISELSVLRDHSAVLGVVASTPGPTTHARPVAPRLALRPVSCLVAGR
ncbi:hypothetical protein ACFU76_37315 [Streptomyces sp. NPDC057539]|uniref:hypothetical protein n=1 Tax=Streptomyces sp. NPDC057539 TaxID=3346159 RepID=UPI0036AFD8C4